MSAGDGFDCAHQISGDFDLQAGKVLPHVIRISGSGQWQDTDCPSKAEHQLRRSGFKLSRNINERRMLQHFRIRGQK